MSARLTGRGNTLLACTLGLLLIAAPGFAEMLGEQLWPTKTSTGSGVGEVPLPVEQTWVDPSQEVAGTVARNAVPAATPTRASRSHPRLPLILLRIRWCESRGDYRAENPTSTASGAWQILDGTWNGYSGYQHAADAPRVVQDAKALALYLDRGTQPWNASRRCWR